MANAHGQGASAELGARTNLHALPIVLGSGSQASDVDFLTVGGWYDGVDGHWGDDFARPLGPPLADAVYNGTARHREFASGTKVMFTPHTNAAGKDMGGVGSISWGAKAF